MVVGLRLDLWCLRLFNFVEKAKKVIKGLLLSKIWLILNVVTPTSKISKILRIQNLRYFFFGFSGCLKKQLCFLPNTSCKTYPGPMLPPGSRKWQLNNLNFILYPFKCLLKNIVISLYLGSLVVWKNGRCYWSPNHTKSQGKYCHNWLL